MKALYFNSFSPQMCYYGPQGPVFVDNTGEEKDTTPTNPMIQNLINHIVFVVDASGSMKTNRDEAVKVFDSQIAYLAKRSKELNQETRVSVYLFNDRVQCLIYDMDVMRLPSLGKHYYPNGNTALIDGTLKAIADLKLTPELYGDHAFLIYVLTDGEENRSTATPAQLSKEITGIKSNWTFAALVPNSRGLYEAKKFGFSPENIQIWETSASGINEIGEVMRQATDSYMTSRSTGIRSTKSLFKVSASLNPAVVKGTLVQLNPNEYFCLPVHKTAIIKDFVESWTQSPYRIGSAYYQLTKPEVIQAHKQVCVTEKLTGKVYSGVNARKLLGLPDAEIKVAPDNYGDYTIFVQSKSINRKLVAGTSLIVLK
jgi:hypothetical protein